MIWKALPEVFLLSVNRPVWLIWGTHAKKQLCGPGKRLLDSVSMGTRKRWRQGLTRHQSESKIRHFHNTACTQLSIVSVYQVHQGHWMLDLVAHNTDLCIQGPSADAHSPSDLSDLHWMLFQGEAQAKQNVLPRGYELFAPKTHPVYKTVLSFKEEDFKERPNVSAGLVWVGVAPVQQKQKRKLILNFNHLVYFQDRRLIQCMSGIPNREFTEKTFARVFRPISVL